MWLGDGDDEDEQFIDPSLVDTVCSVCKGTDFRTHDNGAFLICADCGTEVRGRVEEVSEAFETAGATYRKRKVGPRPDREPITAPEVDPRPSADLVFEAFQCVLQALLDALVSKCGCDAALLPTVRALWFRVLPLCTDTKAPDDSGPLPPLKRVPWFAPNGLVRQPERPKQWRSGPGASKGFAPGLGAVPLGSALALALCHLGCLQLSLPVRVDDLIAWCRCDVLPLLRVHVDLPAKLEPVARWLPGLVGMAGVA